MAEHFKKASRCPNYLVYLEKPMHLKCGYTCCFHCLNSLKKEPHGEGLLCPLCPVVSQKNNIRPNSQLGRLVSKAKDLETHLRALLKMNPRMLQFQANNYLIISEDLRREKCRLPNIIGKSVLRFQTICVLGTTRFTSGQHYWNVDIQTSKDWILGVCKESVPRKGEHLLSSKRGFWTVGALNGEHYSVSTTPLTPIQVKPQLHRIGIFLDMDIGNISFCDIRDGSHFFTVTKISTAEPLCLFFAPTNPGKDGQGFLSIFPVINLNVAAAPVYLEQSK